MVSSNIVGFSDSIYEIPKTANPKVNIIRNTDGVITENSMMSYVLLFKGVFLASLDECRIVDVLTCDHGSHFWNYYLWKFDNSWCL